MDFFMVNHVLTARSFRTMPQISVLHDPVNFFVTCYLVRILILPWYAGLRAATMPKTVWSGCRVLDEDK